MKLTRLPDDGLTLETCTKTELIALVRKIVEVCGPAAEIALDLELTRAELMRMKAVIEGGSAP